MRWCYSLRTVITVTAIHVVVVDRGPDLRESAHGDSLCLRASPQDGANSLLQAQWGLFVLQNVGQDPQVLAILQIIQLVSKPCLNASST